MRWVSRFFLLALILSVAAPAAAERLALRRYTTADGLPSDTVRVLLRDSLGLLWIGTDEGLARFDGRTFRTFDAEAGLPHATIKSLHETLAGELWVGTAKGLAVLSLRGDSASHFEFVPLTEGGIEQQPSVMALDEGPDGALWIGTTVGAFHLQGPAGARKVESFPIDFINTNDETINWEYVRSVLAAPDGSVWFGTSTGVYRCERHGSCRHTTRQDLLPNPYIHSLLRGNDGRIWASGRGPGIAQVSLDADGKALAVAPFKQGMPLHWVMQLALEDSRTMWAATLAGLVQLDMSDPRQPRIVRRLGRQSGFPHDEFSAIAFAEDGVVFLGHPFSGLVRWDRRGVTSYVDDPGLPGAWIERLFRAQNGEWFGISFGPTAQLVQQINGAFVSVAVRLPAGQVMPWLPTALHARDRRWWIPTTEGVCIFPPSERVDALKGTNPERCLGKREGLPGSPVFGLFEDSQGDVWIGSERDRLGALGRWRTKLQRYDSFGPDQGLPDIHFAHSFAEDRSGAIWMASYARGLLRYKHGRFEQVGSDPALRSTTAHEFLIDRSGRLWVSYYSHGLYRCDDPTAEVPVLQKVGRERGLISEQGGALAEDRFGQIYHGTSQGLFRIDPANHTARRFGLEDGFPTLYTRAAIEGADGRIWVALDEGFSVLTPTVDTQTLPPDPVIVGVRAGGLPLELPLLGRAQIEQIELPASRSSIELSVSAPSLKSAARVLFQSRLKGTDEAFGPATADNTRLYPSLSPGSHRIEIRSVGPTGAISAGVAHVDVRVLAPLWRRGWFIATIAALFAAFAYLAHRQNLEKRLAVERMRLRIATDLHDDLGSSLSSIALQSEVLGKTAPGLAPAERDRLKQIGASAAAMVETMSDIVWAVNPRYDRLSQLAHRMHRFARETLAPAGIAVSFEETGGLDDVALDSAARRQIYLIFKESIHNALKHSGATQVSITIARHGARTRMEVRDDGRGFDPTKSGGTGLGIESMRRRVLSIGGTLTLDTAPGEGTRVVIEA
ncbi:MAG: two-component regulator propeller domain-containing protein [Acidobacteriota bacterium]